MLEPVLSRRLLARVLVAMTSEVSVNHQGFFFSGDEVLPGVGGGGGSLTGAVSVRDAGCGLTSEAGGLDTSGRAACGVKGAGSGRLVVR